MVSNQNINKNIINQRIHVAVDGKKNQKNVPQKKNPPKWLFTTV